MRKVLASIVAALRVGALLNAVAGDGDGSDLENVVDMSAVTCHPAPRLALARVDKIEVDGRPTIAP